MNYKIMLLVLFPLCLNAMNNDNPAEYQLMLNARFDDALPENGKAPEILAVHSEAFILKDNELSRPSNSKPTQSNGDYVMEIWPSKEGLTMNGYHRMVIHFLIFNHTKKDDDCVVLKKTQKIFEIPIHGKILHKGAISYAGKEVTLHIEMLDNTETVHTSSILKQSNDQR